MSKRLHSSWMVGSAVCLAGCIADATSVNEEARSALLEAYQSSSAIAQYEEARRAAAVRVTANPIGNGLLLSADLTHANLDAVMREILEDQRIQYQMDHAQFPGRVSARFRDKPLLDGLNALLAGTTLRAAQSGSVVTFSNLPVSEFVSRAENAKSIREEIVLNHLAAADAEQLLLNLFSSDSEEEEDVGLSVGSLSELNAVYLSGPARDVFEARSILEQADRPVAHVIIEALVVNLNTSSAEELGVSLGDGASGKFEALKVVPGQTGGNIVATFSDLAANAAQVTATIEFLAAQNAAQVLARPYIATRSTMPAQIEIVSDQFARVSTTGDDASIISTDSVTAGVTLSVTPLVMADEGIRLDMTIEDSRFGVTAGDILITKDRNTASTSMIVKSGQTIVIGGLNSHYRITENMGPPWLRRVPVLNTLLASQGAIEVRDELVVYLTPYIWIPSLDTPLPLPGMPDVDMGESVSFERLLGR
ncbi:MAG: secretin N-terminal domain-containing protein [Pseudomonadota bacterium]